MVLKKRMKSKLSIIYSLIWLIYFWSVNTHLYAQRISVEATGTVLKPLSANGSDLRFGSIYPGIKKDVIYSSSNAAGFTIEGEPGEMITADFTLPSSMVHTENSLFTLNIAFSNTDSGYNIINDPSDATDYDPAANLTTSLGSEEGKLYIWLGGSVDPGILQEKGDYTGVITLDIAYTGN